MNVGDKHRLERLNYFSDAVFAIAITLLIIELHPPHLSGGGSDAALDALAGLTPSFFGFALSFAVIGRFWVGHHSALSSLVSYDPKLLLPNMALLMTIVFMPFATAFMAANLGQVVPTVFYNATLTATALLSCRVVWVATAPERGHSTHSAAERRELRTRGIAVVLAAVLALALAFIVPNFNQLALLSIPLWRLAVHRPKRAEPQPEAEAQ